jgi:hypothetical protein
MVVTAVVYDYRKSRLCVLLFSFWSDHRDSTTLVLTFSREVFTFLLITLRC